MRLANLSAALFFFAAPAVVSAQYDFDDFIDAVQSGQSKSQTPAPESTRLALLPSGPRDVSTDTVASSRPVPTVAVIQVEPIPFEMQESAEPDQVNFEEVFQQQAMGLPEPELNYSDASNAADCQTCRGTAHCRACTVMPYQAPNLPAPSSLRGYFNASPCIANLWDGYACEAALECAKTQQSINGTHRKSRGYGRGKAHCD